MAIKVRDRGPRTKRDGVQKYPLAVVVWNDAWSNYEVEEITECLQETVGFLVEKTSKVVRVAQTRDADSVCDVCNIPRGMVRSIKVIK
jgi:hypothetical protein